MKMRLTTSEREELRKLQHNLYGSSDYASATCILMLDTGYTLSAISDCLGISISTVYRYNSSYLHDGEGELLENRHKGYWGLFDNRWISTLCKELREQVYPDSKSVARWIKAALGVGVHLPRHCGFAQPQRLHQEEEHRARLHTPKYTGI